MEGVCDVQSGMWRLWGQWSHWGKGLSAMRRLGQSEGFTEACCYQAEVRVTVDGGLAVSLEWGVKVALTVEPLETG